MKRTYKLLLSCAVLALLQLPALAQNVINQSFEGISKIDISISSGDIVFEKSADKKVSVAMTSTANEYDPTIEKQGNKLVINEDKMRNVRSWSGSVSWTIALPDGLEIDHNTGSGDIKISGLKVTAGMNSGSGNFRITASEGEIDINTGSGDIEATAMKGVLKMNCGSGDISLDDMNAEITANVGSGDIDVAKLVLTGKSSFNSGSGDVQVGLAEALAYDISVNSGSGDATLDFNSNKIEGQITMEANKQNGKIVAPFEFDSTEEINRGNNTTVRKTKKMGSSDVKIKVSTGSGTAELKAN